MEDEYLYCYKYMPIDKGSLQVVTSGTLKFTCPLSFNDPFDCRPYYCPEALNELSRTKSKLFQGAAKQMGLSPAKGLQERGKHVKKLQRYIDSGQHLIDLLSTIGVLSLSRVANNILMWSHYAKFHQGFVAEFKIPTKGYLNDIRDVGEMLIPQNVLYAKERPRIRYGIDERDDVIDKTLLTKSNLWSYENEVRVIEAVKGPGIHPYTHSHLNSVITGMNMASEDLAALKEAVERTSKIGSLSHLKLYEARPCKEHYRVLIPGHPIWGEETS